jgi:hypothetical protein
MSTGVRDWCEEGLEVRKKRRRCRKGSCVTLLGPEKANAPNLVWTLGFVEDRLSKGIGMRLLTVLDEITKESLYLRVERRLRFEDVRLTLQLLFKDCGIPKNVRSDNDSEFMARCLRPRASIPYVLSATALDKAGWKLKVLGHYSLSLVHPSKTVLSRSRMR